MRRLTVFVLALCCVPLTAAAQELNPVQITEWTVPWEESRPRDPFVAGDKVWFVGQRADYIGRLDPATGDFERFDLGDGAGPHNVVVGPAGYPWYAGNRATHIGRLDPADGSITKYPMPDPAARDPHTLYFAPDGNLWFTVQGGNFIGRLTPETGKVDLIEVPTPDARPYGIDMDSSERPWVVEFGTNKIALVNPETLELREFTLPFDDARPRRIAITSDDMVWYVDYSRGSLGRMDPTTGEVMEWPAPGGAEARPYGMTVDDEDRLWFVETGPEPNRLVGFDPEMGEFFSVTEIESGGGAVRHMVFDEATSTIWFGTDTNTIGRAVIP